MPRELAQLRNTAGKLLVGVLWLAPLIVAALASPAPGGWQWLAGSSLLLAAVASIAWWSAGPARLARLIVSASLSGQVLLLTAAGSGTGLEGELGVLPFAALTALVAYGDRGAVMTAGVLLAAGQAAAWNASQPASGMLPHLAIMALQTAGLGWLARVLRGFAVRAARARHAAAAHLVLVSRSRLPAGSSSRLELILPAFSPAPGRRPAGSRVERRAVARRRPAPANHGGGANSSG
jgi:hypothetical protein